MYLSENVIRDLEGVLHRGLRRDDLQQLVVVHNDQRVHRLLQFRNRLQQRREEREDTQQQQKRQHRTETNRKKKAGHEKLSLSAAAVLCSAGPIKLLCGLIELN